MPTVTLSDRFVKTLQATGGRTDYYDAGSTGLVLRVAVSGRKSWCVVYARARDGAHASRLLALGARHVVPETIEASLELSELVLTGAGVPDDAARQLIEVRRQAEQTALDESRGGGGT